MIGDDPTGKQAVIIETDKLNAQNVLILADISAIITDIANLAAAILELTETGGTITTDGTEQNVYINNDPVGLYSPEIILIDFTNHTAGETIEIKEYYRIKSGGNLILYKTTSYAGAVDPPLVSHALQKNRYGIKVTIEKTAGTNRDYDWEAIYKI